MKKSIIFLYGIIAYGYFFIVFLYLIGFVGNLFVPKTVDSGQPGPVWLALSVNLVLIALFGIQHSIMARQGFKRWWTRIVPKAMERSTFVIVGSSMLVVMFVFWQPMPEVVWHLGGAAGGLMLAASALGWLIVLASTFIIDHFDLFGLRQVYLHFRARDYTPLPFATRYLYRFVRHPLYLGFMIAFWFAPVMTVGHLLLAAGFTAYILIAVRLEEKDMVRFHGRAYLAYQDQVPMLVPRPGMSVPDSGRSVPSA
jgi:protein-S-isoprenylcysteine O-methyltransferase Ste14